MNLDNIKGLQDLNIEKINIGIRPFVSSIIILVLAFVLIRLTMFLTQKIIDFTKFNEQREKTLKSVIDSVAAYFIITFAILTIMSEFGLIKSATIITGAGIFTLVAGLGAQNLIKDFINGFFLLFERQMKVGDFVSINEKYFGTVEEIGLRATAIREWSLSKIYIPNGEIKTLKNYYKEKARVIIEIFVPFEENHDETEKALKEVCTIINEKYGDRLYKVGNTNFSEFDLVGVIGFSGIEGGAKYIVTGVVKAHSKWFVRNRTYETVLRIFNERNLKIAYPKIWHDKKNSKY